MITAAIIKVALPLALWILGQVFAKVSNDTKAKKSYLLFVNAIERDQLASVKLNTADRLQMDELLRRRALLHEEKENADT